MPSSKFALTVIVQEEIPQTSGSLRMSRSETLSSGECYQNCLLFTAQRGCCDRYGMWNFTFSAMFRV